MIESWGKIVDFLPERTNWSFTHPQTLAGGEHVTLPLWEAVEAKQVTCAMVCSPSDVLSLAIVTRPRSVWPKETEDRVGSKCNCPSSDGTLPQRWKFQFYWPNTPLKPQKPLLGDFGGKEIGNRKWCIELIDLISFENVGFNGHRNPNGWSGKVKCRPERWFYWMSPEFLLLCCDWVRWGGEG